MRVGVFQKFLEKLVHEKPNFDIRLLCHHNKVTAAFLKKSVIFTMKSQAVQILYAGLFFDTESYNA